MSRQRAILIFLSMLFLGGRGAVCAPAAPELSWELTSPAWYAGEMGTLRITGISRPVTVAVADSEGQRVWSKSLSPDRQTVALRLPIRSAGYFTLTIQTEEGTKQANFAVVPRRSAGKATLTLGMCTHFAQRVMPDAAYDLLSRMGVDAVRDELSWGSIEPEKGAYTFPPRYEEYLRKLDAHRLKLFWVAGYGSPLYGGRKPSVPEGTRAFGRYCVEVLKRHSPRILAVEIYNEPNDFNPEKEYLPLLESCCRQIRDAGFSQPVVAVGGAGIGGGMNPDFAAKLFAAGGDRCCDGFSQHPYMSPSGDPDAGYATHYAPTPNANLDLALGKSAELLRRAGKTRGGWITELGWPAPTHVSERKQAAFTARTLLGCSRYPHLEGLFLYDFQDDGPDPANKEHRFGLVRQDLTPKPAYQAYAVAANFLRGKRFVRRIFAEDSLLTANLYQDEQGHTWAACWTTEVTVGDVKAATAGAHPLPPRHLERENRLRFRIRPAPGKPLAGFDWQGRALPRREILAASSLPLYLDLGRQADTLTLEVDE